MVDVAHGQFPERRRVRLRNVATESPGLTFFVVDVAVLVVLAIAVGAAAVVFAGGPWLRSGFPAALVLPAAMLLAALNLSGAYTLEAIERPGRIVRRVGLLWILMQASIFATVASYGEDLSTLDRRLLLFAFLAPISMLPHRGLYAYYLRRISGLRRRRVFLLAENAAVADDYAAKDRVVILAQMPLTDTRFLQRLAAEIRSSGCDEIHILLAGSASVVGSEFVRALRLASLPIRLIASPDQSELLRFPISRVGSGYAFDLQGPRLSLADRLAKRSFDLFAAASLCLLFAPLLLVVAASVRCTSAGPALFKQPRVGRDGQVFLIYKFRTMSVLERGPEVCQATRGDLRVTPLGRMLRMTSIDELPQLFNVLLGDMSLVGPRPHAVAHDRDFSDRVLEYRVRQLMKPGLTGLAQVSGSRGEVADLPALERRVAFDLRYIEEWSLLLDIKILARTLAAVFAWQDVY